MTIEELSQQLIAMAAKPTPCKADYVVIKKLMCDLKKSGMSNEDIAAISGQRWSASSVKGYTKGAKSSSESPWQGHAAILKEMIEKSITVGDVQQILGYIDAAEEKGASIDDLLDVCFVCTQGEVELDDLIQNADEIKKTGVAMNEIAGALNQIHELKKNGIGMLDLPTLVQTAANYGGMQAVIKGISAHASLQDINKKVNTAVQKLEATKKEQQQLEKEIQKATAELENQKKPLNALEKVTKLGFGGPELNMLAVKTEKYGGVKKFMTGFDKFADCQAICHAGEEAEQALTKVKDEVNKLYIKYDSLKAATEMCQVLIGEHRFYVDNLKGLLAVAEKYGEPASIIGALNTYNGIADVEAAKAGLDEQIEQKKHLLSETDEQYQQELKLLDQLQATVVQVDLTVEKLELNIKKSSEVRRLLRLMKNPVEADFKEHAPIVLPILTAIKSWMASHGNELLDMYNTEVYANNLIRALGGSVR